MSNLPRAIPAREFGALLATRRAIGLEGVLDDTQRAAVQHAEEAPRR